LPVNLVNLNAKNSSALRRKESCFQRQPSAFVQVWHLLCWTKLEFLNEICDSDQWTTKNQRNSFGACSLTRTASKLRQTTEEFNNREIFA
jgi:hypothetical protein